VAGHEPPVVSLFASDVSDVTDFSAPCHEPGFGESGARSAFTSSGAVAVLTSILTAGITLVPVRQYSVNIKSRKNNTLAVNEVRRLEGNQ